MKKIIFIFIFVSCFLSDLLAQTIDRKVSFNDIPIDLYMQIGFLFLYLLLGFLFLLIFIFYPRQRLNLFFSLFNICLAVMTVNIAFSGKGYNETLQDIISRLIGVNILLFILYALDYVKPFYKWFVAFLLFIDIPLAFFLKQSYEFPGEIFHTAFTIISFLLAVIAFRKKGTANWLIGLIALAVCFVNLRSNLLFFANIRLGPDAITGIPPFVISVCSLVYLALRYGRINKSLELQLQHVQTLSIQNLQTEKEKQQILAEQNEKLDQQVITRTSELNNSIQELKSTQAQLIQSAKMASLGELTAGIAHEIQNPLNFVTNFSDVNKELTIELESELDKENISEAKLLAADIRENEEKINHHGKRADAIVKNMLQHSRTAAGVKEPTDINALADEYLRLAYHGMRGKDKSFNANLVTDFDKSIGKINIIQQDIGRVLLNLYNNAFYAVSARASAMVSASANASADKLVKAEAKQLLDITHEVSPTSDAVAEKQNLNPDFKPEVTVSTKKEMDDVKISVKDNGNGISEQVKNKIFQPFFTTKPPGDGTGLGLSLSYDIIIAHGGTIEVCTAEEKGAEFIIILPMKS